MKEKIKSVLMSLRTVNNLGVVNNLLGKVDMMSEEELSQILESEKLTSDEQIASYFQNMVKDILVEKVNSGDYSYYSNAKENDRESRTFSQIKAAYEKVREVLDREGLTTYICGGSVPYFLLNEDSNRKHDDIDTVCKMEDIDKIREALKRAGLYNPEMDSKTYTGGKDDYGFETIIDGVPVGFCPFEYDGEKLSQRSYDPYNHSCKIQEMPLESLDYFVTEYESRDGRKFHTMSLEYIKKTKDNTIGRPKDKMDSEAIDRTGLIRKDVLDKIKLPTLVHMHKEEVEGR
jgi:hypothetical protein